MGNDKKLALPDSGWDIAQSRPIFAARQCFAAAGLSLL
jgi:hypothetical protein